MKTLSKVVALAAILAVHACQQNDPEPEADTGEVQFSFYVADAEGDPYNGRTAEVVPHQIIVTIQDAAGETIHSQEALNVISLNGSFISEPIALEVGPYQLVEYFVNDADVHAIYAAPLEGSALAYLVSDPLPIDFSISEDVSSQLTPEVLSTESVTAADFGYVGFQLNIVETFDFLMAVQVPNESSAAFELTDADVRILGDGVEVFDQAISDITNQITLPDGYGEYTVITTKDDFEPDTVSLDNETLKGHLADPLVVILQKSPVPQQVIDIDGNVYGTIEIGDQVWLDKNLSVVHFNDGTPIAEVTVQATWVNLTTPAYSWYNNDSAVYQPQYGALYNHYVVASGDVCPEGWRVPTSDDWNTLVASVGDDPAYKLAGTDLWTKNAFKSQPTFGQSGLDIVPNGYRNPFDYTGTQPDFFYDKTSSQLWSQTIQGDDADYFYMHDGNSQVYINPGPRVYGFGIRCIMN